MKSIVRTGLTFWPWLLVRCVMVPIDYARQRKAAKRGRGLRVSLEDAGPLATTDGHDFEQLNELLDLLATKDPAAARAVELKLFGGFTDHESALIMGVSTSKLRRDWEFARQWLKTRLQGTERDEAKSPDYFAFAVEES